MRRSYLAFNAALGDLYSDDLMQLADAPDSSRSALDGGSKNPDFDDTAFFDAAGMVYNAGCFDALQLSTPEARRLIAETLKQINRAISSGVSYEVPETVRHALENNAFIFSGFKAYHTLREVGLSLTTDTGEIKPFEQFRRDVEKINNQYNHNYLYAEYNHAVGASLMAERWQKIEADGDKYDLQYRTAMDDRVREDHAILHNTTLPPSDPFWEMYLPPNGWNCRCTAVQVRKGRYPQSDPALAMLRGNNCTEAAKQQIFRFNPGKTLELFPPKHPYFKAPDEAKKVVEQLALRREANRKLFEELSVDDNYTNVAFDYESGGISAEHILHNFDKFGGEYERNVAEAGRIAGHSVIFGVERGSNERKTEGFWDGMRFEVAGRETGTINNIKRGLEHCADKRTTEIAVLDFPFGGFSLEKLEIAIRRYKGLEKLGDGQFIRFKKIICVQNKRIVYEADF